MAIQGTGGNSPTRRLDQTAKLREAAARNEPAANAVHQARVGRDGVAVGDALADARRLGEAELPPLPEHVLDAAYDRAEDSMKRAMAAYDTDGSGAIDNKELDRWIKERGGDKAATLRFTNKDGDLVLSAAELQDAYFRQYVAEARQAKAPPPAPPRTSPVQARPQPARVQPQQNPVGGAGPVAKPQTPAERRTSLENAIANKLREVQAATPARQPVLLAELGELQLQRNPGGRGTAQLENAIAGKLREAKAATPARQPFLLAELGELQSQRGRNRVSTTGTPHQGVTPTVGVPAAQRANASVPKAGAQPQLAAARAELQVQLASNNQMAQQGLARVRNELATAAPEHQDALMIEASEYEAMLDTNAAVAREMAAFDALPAVDAAKGQLAYARLKDILTTSPEKGAALMAEAREAARDMAGVPFQPERLSTNFQIGWMVGEAQNHVDNALRGAMGGADTLGEASAWQARGAATRELAAIGETLAGKGASDATWLQLRDIAGQVSKAAPDQLAGIMEQARALARPAGVPARDTVYQNLARQEDQLVGQYHSARREAAHADPERQGALQSRAQAISDRIETVLDARHALDKMGEAGLPPSAWQALAADPMAAGSPRRMTALAQAATAYVDPANGANGQTAARVGFGRHMEALDDRIEGLRREAERTTPERVPAALARLEEAREARSAFQGFEASLDRLARNPATTDFDWKAVQGHMGVAAEDPTPGNIALRVGDAAAQPQEHQRLDASKWPLLQARDAGMFQSSRALARWSEEVTAMLRQAEHASPEAVGALLAGASEKSHGRAAIAESRDMIAALDATGKMTVADWERVAGIFTRGHGAVSDAMDMGDRVRELLREVTSRR